MSKTVESNRILYIPSEFAKESLIYLQEVGESKTLEKHTNSRNKLDSYLFFIVLDGNGTLTYNNKTYNLSRGSCVFIDCNNKYSHFSDNWTIKWVHFNGNNMSNIYKKYLELNGLPSFNTSIIDSYVKLINQIHSLANSNISTKDIKIYNLITSLLSTIIEETKFAINNNDDKRIYNVESIRNYIDSNYNKNITLDSISDKFFINKYYLTRLFKNTYGITINKYINDIKITKAKELLRFNDMSIVEISNSCGFNDPNYFIRLFKQIEGLTPKEYKYKW